MEKEWKDIKGYEGLYQISNYGEVKSLLPTPTLLKPFDKDGYQRIGLYKNGKYKNFLVHQLVGLYFLNGYKTTDECGELRIYINHKDKNKTNNKWFNLEWVSMNENFQHSKIYDCLISDWVEDYPLYLTIVEEHIM